MKESTLPTPSTSTSGITIESRINNGSRLTTPSAFRSIYRGIILGRCDQAEASISECRKTKRPETCQAANMDVALCLHYQNESYGA
jgi:hypothetical protein